MFRRIVAKLRRLAVLSMVVAMPATALAQQNGAGASDVTLTLYNAQHERLTQSWIDAFTRETGIKVVMRSGSDTELGNLIVQEGAASPADVFLTENSPAMVLVDNSGLLAPLDPKTLEQVEPRFRPSHGRWTAIAARSTVFAYDKLSLEQDQLPKSVMDLADPAWKGRWAAAPAGADFQAIVGAILVLKGEEATLAWLKALKENAVLFKSNSLAMKGVNVGQAEGALIYHYYWYGDRARTGENSMNVSLHFFTGKDPGGFLSVSGAGVLASGKHPAEAQAFVRWITGKAGQEVLRTGDSFEYAVGVGAASNPSLKPLAELDPPVIDPSTLDSRKVTDLLTRAGLL